MNMDTDVQKKLSSTGIKVILKAVLKVIAPGFVPTDENLNFISGKIKYLHIKKGEYFVKEGEISSVVGILLDQKGVLKAYSCDEEGTKKVTRIFYSPNNLIVSSFESFKERTAANESIIAVTDVLLLAVSHDDLQLLYDSIPSFNAIGRILAEQSYITVLKKYREMQTMSGKQRVANFYGHSKSLINVVDTQDIATYLGLSRNKYSDYLKEVIRND